MAVKCILTGQTPSVLDGVTENVQTQIDAKAADNAVVHLAGNETISGTKTFTGGVVMKGGADVASSGNAILNVEGVATDTDYINMYVSGGTNTTRPLVLQNNSSGSGNVGIGTATPSEKLEVVGNVKATKFKGDGSELTNVPYPVTSVAGKTGAVTLAASDVGAIATVENLTVSDSLSYTMTDGTIKAGFQKIDNDTHMVLVGYSNVEDRCVGLFVRPNSDYAQISVGFYNQSNGDMDIANPAVTFTNLANPLINTDAANKAYVDTSVSTKQSKITTNGILKGDGTGTVTAAEETEVELVEVTADSIGAASKEYVDSVATGTTLSVTLASASWTGTAAPYTYTISNSAITATSTQEVSPATDITADQLTALQSANIIDGGQATGSMTLKAFGEKPSVDIPVRIIVKG